MDQLICTCKDLFGEPCQQHATPIEDWELRWLDQQLGTQCLFGKIDGHDCTTTVIRQASGLFVLTIDGKLYRLGKVKSSWLQWLKKHNHIFDPNDPIPRRGRQ